MKPLDDHVDGVKEPSFSRVFRGLQEVHPEGSEWYGNATAISGSFRLVKGFCQV